MSANKLVSFKDLYKQKREQVPETPPLPDRVPVPESPPVESTTPPRPATGGESAGPTPPASRIPPPEVAPVPDSPPLLPWDAPHLRTPHATIERFRELKPGPRVLVEEIYRASAGWNSDECVISIPKLAKHCKLDEKQVRKYLLEVDGKYVKRLEVVNDGRDVSLRGIRFRLLIPRLAPPPQKGTPPESGTGVSRPPNKRKDLNQDSKSVVCDRCKDMSGMYYPSGTVGVGPVKKCTHGEGN